VLAVARDHLAATPRAPRRADVLAAAGAWHRISCGNSAKGRRGYDWALFATTRPEISLLVRGSVTRPSGLAFYLCHTPQPTPIAVLVKVAATRWCLEECFQTGNISTVPFGLRGVQGEFACQSRPGAATQFSGRRCRNSAR